MFPSGSSDNLRTTVINVCFHKQVSQIETVTEIRSSFLAGFSGSQMWYRICPETQLLRNETIRISQLKDGNDTFELKVVSLGRH